MSGAESVSIGMTPDEVRAKDVVADLARRARWAQEFSTRGPSYADDVSGAPPRFHAWLGGQSQDARDALAEYWTREARANPDIAHGHERGGYARLTMLMAYATEVYGYRP